MDKDNFSLERWLKKNQPNCMNLWYDHLERKLNEILESKHIEPNEEFRLEKWLEKNHPGCVKLWIKNLKKIVSEVKKSKDIILSHKGIDEYSEKYSGVKLENQWGKEKYIVLYTLERGISQHSGWSDPMDLDEACIRLRKSRFGEKNIGIAKITHAVADIRRFEEDFIYPDEKCAICKKWFRYERDRTDIIYNDIFYCSKCYNKMLNEKIKKEREKKENVSL